MTSASILKLAFTRTEKAAAAAAAASAIGRTKPTGPLVILHGLLGSKQNWKSLSKRLSADLATDVYALDLRNHGSSPHNPLHTTSVMANDVAEFIRDHKLTNVSLLGHSMGGRTAMTLALERPELVERLVVVDTAPSSYIDMSEFPVYIDALMEIERANLTSLTAADKMLKVHVPSLSIRQFLLTNMVREQVDGGEYLRSRVPLQIIRDNLPVLARFTADRDGRTFDKPSVFLAGLKANYITEKNRPDIKRLFPQSTVVDFNTGHWVHAEAPNEFIQTVTNFVSNN
ncbi:alpha/beta hydrolase fold protein [Ramicandelaber brevisporus]|nr:alpha/beta hydrolase fold protein [Ramicandelaber brevisporus]